jgi:thiol-disulfide isomerase/thioredoxin
MKLLITALVYTALTTGANAADLEALREGDMKKLALHDTPRPASAAAFTTPEGAEKTLADWRGRHVLVNFWATWCAPCREEMPSLDALNAAYGGEGFAVVTVATGRNPPPAIHRFFEENGIETLPVLMDPTQQLAREMGVLGLPVSVLLNPEGEEIGRLIGDADWASDSARAIVDALVSEAGEG